MNNPFQKELEEDFEGGQFMRKVSVDNHDIFFYIFNNIIKYRKITVSIGLSYISSTNTFWIFF